MVFDCLENKEVYYGLNPEMKLAFDFLTECAKEPKPEGRYELDGDKLYAMVMPYVPAASGTPNYEAHNNYIDIQFMLKGSEDQYYAPRKDLKVSTPYSDEKDVVFFETPENGTKLHMTENAFAIYFPCDGHAPAVPDGIAKACCRIVVKVKY